jgi:hypothetical protein
MRIDRSGKAPSQKRGELTKKPGFLCGTLFGLYRICNPYGRSREQETGREDGRLPDVFGFLKSERMDMTHLSKFASAIGVCGLLLAVVGAIRANDVRNAEPLPPPNVLSPVPGTPAPAVPAPPEMPGGNCCPCIEYRHHGRPICCCDCNAPPEIKTVLQVKNPATCCVVPIPICLPGCCTGEPCVSSRCGILGRGIVRYDYCCGVKIIVTFRACGDIVVSYWHA